jgi:hypothetical protein
MIAKFALAAAMFSLGLPHAIADEFRPKPKTHQRSEKHVVHYYRPALTPSCIEKGSPIYGGEPVLLCVQGVIVVPPYDQAASQSLATIRRGHHGPYDQLFAWHYGPARFQSRRAAGFAY